MAKVTTLRDLAAVVKQVTSGQVAAAPEDVAEAVTVVDTADNWIARVRIALDRTKIKQLQLPAKESGSKPATEPSSEPSAVTAAPSSSVSASGDAAAGVTQATSAAEFDDEEAAALSLQVR